MKPRAPRRGSCRMGAVFWQFAVGKDRRERSIPRLSDPACDPRRKPTPNGLLPLREKVAEGRMRGRATGSLWIPSRPWPRLTPKRKVGRPLIRPFGPPSPSRGEGDDRRGLRKSVGLLARRERGRVKRGGHRETRFEIDERTQSAGLETATHGVNDKDVTTYPSEDPRPWRTSNEPASHRADGSAKGGRRRPRPRRSARRPGEPGPALRGRLRSSRPRTRNPEARR